MLTKKSENESYRSLDNLAKNRINSKLEDSKLFKFYEKFDEVTNLDSALFSSEKLEKIPSEYKEGIYKKLWNNLYRLSKYTEYFSNIQEKNDNICAYLKFWFYDRILSENVKALNINTFLARWEEFKKYVFQSNNCPCDFFPIKLKEIKELKRLHDYVIFHEDLKLEGDIHEKMCNDINLNLLKESIGIYIQKDVECGCNNNSAYCKEFNKYIKKYANEDVIDSFKDKCGHVDSSEAYEKRDDVDVTKDTIFTELIKDSEFFNIIPINKFYEELNKRYKQVSESSCICDIFTNNKFPNDVKAKNLCNCLKKMLENWDNSLEQLKAGCNERTCCDYLNYWLHEKMEKSRYNQKTIQYIYAAWDVINRNRKKGYNYCWYKNFKLASSEFNNKKQLYEFLEHYDSIKNKLNNVDSSNNIEYCTFIKKMFDLYLEMEKSNTAQIYNDEIRYFQQKINCELSYVKTKCSDKCLHLVFQTKNDNFCQPNVKPKEVPKENNIGELSKSPKKYEDFNSEENIDIYCNFCTEILPLERDYPGINELCKKLARNLIDITKETAENNDDIKNNCEYLTHWIYDEMRKLPSSTSQSIGNIPFVHKLLDAGYRINETLKNKHCRFKYYRDYSFEELKEMKELHDFFKIYNDINNKITTIGSENSNYCKYISHIYDLYKKYIKNCCEYYYKENHYNDNCSDYFNCDKTYDPNNLLIKLNCSSKLSDEESKKVYDVATIDRLAKLMTEKSEEQSKLLSKSMSEKSKVQTESLAELVTVKPQEQSELIFKDRNVLITSENLFSALLNDPFYVASLGFFGLLGIFFTLFCFYKFTPLGSNFRKKSSGYEISKNNYNQKGRKKLLYENSESNNTNLKNRPYKLAYQSS